MSTLIQDIEIFPTRDFPVLHGIMRHPAVYPFIIDDSSPAVDRAFLIQAAIYLLVAYQHQVGGFFGLQPTEDNGGYIVHTVMLPSCRGSKALRAAKLGIEWVFKNTEAERIETYSFKMHKDVTLFCRLAGFREVGRHIHTYTVNGEPATVIDFLLTKQDFEHGRTKCQQQR